VEFSLLTEEGRWPEYQKGGRMESSSCYAPYFRTYSPKLDPFSTNLYFLGPIGSLRSAAMLYVLNKYSNESIRRKVNSRFRA
jgi:hypothetical protein